MFNTNTLKQFKSSKEAIQTSEEVFLDILNNKSYLNLEKFSNNKNEINQIIYDL